MKNVLKEIPLSKVLPAVAVAILSVLVYVNTLDNGFVYDDQHQVLKNRWIRDTSNIIEVLTSSAWGFKETVRASNYYRPLMHLVYMADFGVFGLRPRGFHISNILFHALNSVMVFFTTLFLLKKHHPAMVKENGAALLLSFAGAALFATNPINTEAVAWIAGIPELTFTFFYLMSFYLYIKYRERRGIKTRYYLFSVLFFFLSTLGKEPALTLPLFLLAYDLILKRDIGFRSPLREWAKRYLPFGAAAIIYIMLRMNALSGFAPRLPWHSELTGPQLVMNIFPLLGRYFYKLLVPVNLNIFHVLHPVLSPFDVRFLSSLIFTAFLILVTLRLRIKDPLSAFLLLWIVVPLLPVLYIPVLGENSFAERYLYLPSAGFSILLSMTIYKLFQVLKAERPRAFLMSIALLLILYSTGTVDRNKVWHDDVTLFTDTVRKSPDGALPCYSLGFAYFKRGELDEAIKWYKKALAMKPYKGDWHYDIALAYQKRGLIDEAITHYVEALHLGYDEDANTHNNLANAYAKKGMFKAAVHHYRQALLIDPENKLARRNLSIVMKMLSSSGAPLNRNHTPKGGAM